jgi:type VII secretion protein EssB
MTESLHVNPKMARGKLPASAKQRKRKHTIVNADPETITEDVPLSSLRAKDAQMNRLAFDDRFLVPLTIEVDGETARMTYHIAGLRLLDDIRKESVADQYRLLSNVGELRELANHYDFDLDPDNLYYDRNLSVRVMRRDIRDDNAPQDFDEKYRCLCGRVLQKRYDYAAYRNGGMSLLNKNKRLREIHDATNGSDIAAGLGGWHDIEHDKMKRTKRLIGRKSFVMLVVCLALSLALAGASGAYAANYLLLRQPYQNRLMQASNAYLLDDYEGVIAAVQGDAVSALPKETRYTLARSYVQAESLSQQQKSNILALLTMKTEDTLINYWIALGRRDYAGARDIAERIQNDEWLLYCLLKQEVDVRNDASISGAEKTSQLDELSREIEELSEKLGEQGEEGIP